GTKANGPPAFQPEGRAQSCEADVLLVVRLHEARELLVEARETAAAVHQLLLAAAPCGVSCEVDVEGQLLAGLAPGSAGLVGRAVVQTDVDEVIVGMDALFHGF